MSNIVQQTTTPMNNTNTKDKTVAYAYPSSSDAEKLGYNKTGCYYAALERPLRRGGIKMDKMTAGPSREEALAIAESWPQPWSRYSFRRIEQEVA